MAEDAAESGGGNRSHKSHRRLKVSEAFSVVSFLGKLCYLSITVGWLDQRKSHKLSKAGSSPVAAMPHSHEAPDPG